MTPEQLLAMATAMGQNQTPATTKPKNVYYLALDKSGNNIGNWFIDADTAEVLNERFKKAKINITLQLPDPDYKASKTFNI